MGEQQNRGPCERDVFDLVSHHSDREEAELFMGKLKAEILSDPETVLRAAEKLLRGLPGAVNVDFGDKGDSVDIGFDNYVKRSDVWGRTLFEAYEEARRGREIKEGDGHECI